MPACTRNVVGIVLQDARVWFRRKQASASVTACQVRPSYYNWTVCGIYPVALPNNKFRMP